MDNAKKTTKTDAASEPKSSAIKHKREKRKKGYDYFDGFCEVGEIAKLAANYLNQALESFNYREIHVYAERMHELENKADSKKHELCNNLAHEFMPPIEREDMSLLSQELDNIVDSVEDVMRKLYMFNIKSIRQDALEFTRLVTQVCYVFCDLLKEFKHFKKSKIIRDFIIEVNTLENKGDKLHAESIRHLFTEELPSGELLAWTMIFESFESCLDVCENAADIIDSIITKNT